VVLGWVLVVGVSLGVVLGVALGITCCLGVGWCGVVWVWLRCVCFTVGVVLSVCGGRCLGGGVTG